MLGGTTRSAGSRPSDDGDRAEPFGWLVNAVAKIRTSVRVKLLVGFLVGAGLLLSMGMLSLGVISRMSARVDDLHLLFQQVDLARQMEYAITAQSHFRAMALLTQDDTNTELIAAAKNEFVADLVRVGAVAGRDQVEFFAGVREANDRFSAAGADALALYRLGDIPAALDLHLRQEHEISHELEASIRDLVATTSTNMGNGVVAIKADHRLVARIVGGFAAVSTSLAVLLGFVLSTSVTRPVRRMGLTMRRMVLGDFSGPLRVPNRDELGELAARINETAQELEKLQDITVAQERARALRERIIQVSMAQEEERRRISRELHDGLAPSLAAIGNTVRSTQRLVRVDPDRAEAELEEVSRSLRRHVQEIRELIYELRPVALDQLGLVGAVRQHAERFGEDTGIRVSFTSTGDISSNPLTEVTLLRVAQECLTNIHKHANATEVEVRLQATVAGLELSVMDDGQGFDPAALSSGGGARRLGLVSMQERSDLIGG
ncbi:MAG: histidine kinase, partial [Chloroflexi bacterium]|nr:histidine kinase [Chloroflexota bacterium]